MIFFCACIVITPTHTSHDYYKQRIDLRNTRVEFIEIDTTLDAISHYKKIYLFATWCPHCYVFLDNFKRSDFPDMALVSTNYNVEVIEEKFYDNIDTVYILSHQAFGSIEKNKILKFTKILTNDVDSIIGLPQKFMKNSNTYVRSNW